MESSAQILPPHKPSMIVDLHAFAEVMRDFFTVESLFQLVWIGLSFVGAYFLTMGPRKQFNAYIQGLRPSDKQKGFIPFLYEFSKALLPLVAIFVMALYMAVGEKYGIAANVVSAGVSLTLAWMLVSFASSFIHTKQIAKWFSVVVWAIAALHIMGWWDSALSLMDSLAFRTGQTRISMLVIVKGIIYFAFFFWLASLLSRAFERQIAGIDGLTLSLKVLFGKLAKIVFIFVAILLGLNAVGVDLTAFAIFSGALGVGLGFGLQKVVSNFISGIILLVDRSIKPGDVIAIGTGENSTFGWVNTLGARYVSIIQRDGKEHLIPNELLITEKVENWSFSNNDIRLHMPVRVSYKSDLRKAMALMHEALLEEPRIKKVPEPVVRVISFGETAVNIEARGWINDPVNGVNNVKSDVYLRIWDKFREHGVEIPYPQQDLHIKSIADEVVRILKNKD